MSRKNRTPLQMALNNASNALDLLGFEYASHGEGNEPDDPRIGEAWDKQLEVCQLVQDIVEDE